MLARRARLAVFAGSIALLACAEIVGIQELETQPAEVVTDGGEVDGASNALLDAAGVADTGPPASDQVKRVFVTSETTTGNMGGVGGGLEVCRRAARRANLSGEWVPWLSRPGEDAIDQLPADVPYERLDRRRVVSRASDLATGALLAPIEITENGTLVERQSGTVPPSNDSRAFVWTGTLANGREGQLHCSNWSSFEGVGILGSASRIDAAWTMTEPIFNAPDSPRGCAFSAHLYCFER